MERERTTNIFVWLGKIIVNFKYSTSVITVINILKVVIEKLIF